LRIDDGLSTKVETRTMKDRLDALTDIIRIKYNNGDPGHDFAHIMRVVATCKKLGAQVGANLDVLIPAAMLHDIVNVPKDHPERTLASQKAADEAKNILKQLKYSQEEVDRISTVITEHSYSLGKKPSSIESGILQDADRLDALGAIGIMRTVSCGCLLKASYYDVEDPFAKSRDLNDKKFTVDHFFTKLFKLPETFNTPEAKVEANKRIVFMKAFLEQLGREI
jgi:uncharacterized protein